MNNMDLEMPYYYHYCCYLSSLREALALLVFSRDLITNEDAAHLTHADFSTDQANHHETESSHQT